MYEMRNDVGEGKLKTNDILIGSSINRETGENHEARTFANHPSRFWELPVRNDVANERCLPRADAPRETVPHFQSETNLFPSHGHSEKISPRFVSSCSHAFIFSCTVCTSSSDRVHQ